MDYYGYSGRVLHVDLTSGEVRKEPLNLDTAKDFIGGFGMNNRLFYDLSKPGVDPLSPENMIILGAGPLIGTLTPGATKLMGTTKFPLSGAIGSASVGMSFGHQLKCASYDHVVITGKAKQPVYLKIFDDEVEICSAEHLWGKGLLETTNMLWEKHGRCGVISIGQAGENLVKFAITLVDKSGNFGRGGLGAVLGSKNLKAIIARGTKGVRIAQRKEFLKSIDSLFERRKKWTGGEAVEKWGFTAMWEVIAKALLFSKNWTEMWPLDKVYQSYIRPLYEGRVKRRGLACRSCFSADKDILELAEGEYKGTILTSGYFDPVLLGTRLGIEDYDKAFKLLEILDEYGLCMLTFGSLLDFLFDLRKRGIITEEEIGLSLRRDFDSIVKLAEQITFRDGFGNILADGWLETIRKIGRGSERYAVIVKGVDCYTDGRVSGINAFPNVAYPRGPQGQSIAAGIYGVASANSVDRFRQLANREGVPDEAIERMLDSPLGVNTGRLARYDEDWATLFNCLGICGRGYINRFYTPAICAQLYSAATGIEISPQELMRAAERGFNLWKVLNVREGFSRKDDVFPDIWFGVIKDADGKEARAMDFFKTRAISREEFEALLDDYYDERGWDIKKGIPTKGKLLELGLNSVAKDIMS